MSIDTALLARLVRENPFQPATSFWRSIELGAVVHHGFPSGVGLDLGCGDGRLMSILLEACATSPRLTGIDMDPHETAAARQSGSYLDVHTASGGRLPLPDGAFDFVFSNSVLEHIEDIDSVMAEVARVLRPGGSFLFTVPSNDFHTCLAGPIVPWRRRAEYLASVDRRCAHKRYWGSSEWAACMLRHGIQLTHSRSYMSGRELQRWETLSRFTSGLLFALLKGRLAPIQIQRSLGMRRRRLHLPDALLKLLARSAAANIEQTDAGPFACLLINGHKPSSATA
jgi:SAM-dependent methyltransferase